jgi:aspartate-semialdehyde dehydrogenase
LASRDARIALVGATGTVGSQLAELIGQRNFSYSELKLFAQESAGRMVEVGERQLPVARLNGAQELATFDLAFLAVPHDVASELIAAKPGPVMIDLSAANVAPRSEVAMVAPGLTERDRVARFAPGEVVAVPHPAAQLIATILRVLRSDGFAAASIMLSASAAGHQGVTDLFQQSADLLNARLDLDDGPQVAFNVFAADSARALAQAWAAQIAMLGIDSGRLVLEIVRVPAFHGSGIALFLPADEAGREWQDRLRSVPGVIAVATDDSGGFVDAVGQEGAITRITLDRAGAAIWCAFDTARLAALTALWIAESLSDSRVS